MKKLIITEGEDDQKFFSGLLSFLEIKDVKVFAANGHRSSKSDIFAISSIKQKLHTEADERKSKILITCDADLVEVGGKKDGFARTKEEFEKLITLLKKEENEEDGLQRDIEYFILPDNNSEGNLESLFLDCLAINKSSLDCVDEYLNCLLSKNISLKQNSKTKALSLIAPIGEGDIYKVGYAAYDQKTEKHREGYWNFEAPALKTLSDFLKKYFN